MIKIFHKLNEYRKDSIFGWMLLKSSFYSRIGYKHGWVKQYDDEMIEALSKTSYLDIFASIWFMSRWMTKTRCFLMSWLMGFVSAAYLDGDVNVICYESKFIKYNPIIRKHTPDDGNYKHCVVERITPDGKHWIYDSADGLMYRKFLYFLIETPKVFWTKDKNYLTYWKNHNKKDITKENFNKYPAQILIPLVESICNTSKYYNEPYYWNKRIDLEITRFKEWMKYDKRCPEVSSIMKTVDYRLPSPT